MSSGIQRAQYDDEKDSKARFLVTTDPLGINRDAAFGSLSDSIITFLSDRKLRYSAAMDCAGGRELSFTYLSSDVPNVAEVLTEMRLTLNINLDNPTLQPGVRYNTLRLRVLYTEVYNYLEYRRSLVERIKGNWMWLLIVFVLLMIVLWPQ